MEEKTFDPFEAKLSILSFPRLSAKKGLLRTHTSAYKKRSAYYKSEGKNDLWKGLEKVDVSELDYRGSREKETVDVTKL